MRADDMFGEARVIATRSRATTRSMKSASSALSPGLNRMHFWPAQPP